jgi:hypothetical protein
MMSGSTAGMPNASAVLFEWVLRATPSNSSTGEIPITPAGAGRPRCWLVSAVAIA